MESVTRLQRIFESIYASSFWYILADRYCSVYRLGSCWIESWNFTQIWHHQEPYSISKRTPLWSSLVNTELRLVMLRRRCHWYAVRSWRRLVNAPSRLCNKNKVGALFDALRSCWTIWRLHLHRENYYFGMIPSIHAAAFPFGTSVKIVCLTIRY